MVPTGGRPSASWVGTQVRVFAVSGLEYAHSEPFVRLVYSELGENGDLEAGSDARGAVRSVESASQPSERLPERRGGRLYTVRWTNRPETDGACTFELPPRVDWVELQVWNRFSSGFDVLLAKTALSVAQLRTQLAGDGRLKDGMQSTDCLWAPLQAPSRDAARDLRGLELSAQLSIGFIYDDRVARIRQQLDSRRAAKTGATGNSPSAGANTSGDPERPELADPAFTFTAPFLPVEWSLVAAASVRQLFFYTDVERVDKFRELVLFGDVACELADAEDLEDEYALHVDPGHLSAFRLAQFAAQYLAHCVDSLDARVTEHRGQLRSLSDTARDLGRRNRALRHQRKRLEQEREQLELMIKTYERLAEGRGESDCHRIEATGVTPSRASLALDLESPSSPIKPPTAVSASVTTASSPRAPSSSPLSAKKPTFIMTWEERERERQREKEATKAQRVQEEQRRLQQRLEERAAQEKRAADAAHQRNQSARTLQRFLCRLLWIQRWNGHRQRQVTCRRAAIAIQARVRQWRLTRAFPVVREELKRNRELRWMHREDELSRQRLTFVETFYSDHQAQQPSNIADREVPMPLDLSETAPKEDVELLVTTWRRLRREICQEASGRARGGASDLLAVFQALDARQDGVVDRAEMRRGIRERYNLQLDRKLTRGLMALIRGKAGEPSLPLLLTFEQFVRGLDLGRSALRSSGSSTTSRLEDSAGATNEQGPDLFSRVQDGSSCEAQQLEAKPLRTQEPLDITDTHESIDRRLEAVAESVQALRKAVNSAAREHLAASGTAAETLSYREFRAAISQIFALFDSDGNGRLDMRELRECLASFGVRVTDLNLALVRECFGSAPTGPKGSGGEEDTVTIAEFISFVLADVSTNDPDSELGLLGFRVRSAVLERLEIARASLDGSGESTSDEDALRWVFRVAFAGKRRECSIRDFARALRTIEGINTLSPAKVVRVAASLDRNGDRSVSFDELLVWLRLRPAPPAPTSTLPAAQATALQLTQPLDRTSGFRAVVRDVSMRIHGLREWLLQLASALHDNGSPRLIDTKARMSVLFSRADANGNGKIARDELEVFLRSLPSAAVDLGSNTEAAIAEQLVDLMDCSGNGVVSREEWTRFALDAHAPIAEEFAVRVTLRSAVETSSALGDHGAMVSQWLERLPGSVPTGMPAIGGADDAHSIQGFRHFKIRVGEFKSAARKVVEASESGGGGGGAMAPFSAVPVAVSALDAAIKRLDTDGSGWITTSKLLQWLFPTRDLEELLRLVRSRWRRQWTSERDPFHLRPDEHAELLYASFDADGNGCLARRELKAGLQSVLGLEFADREVDVMMVAFDADGDHVWRRQEFLAFARQVVQDNSEVGEPGDASCLESGQGIQSVNETDGGADATSDAAESDLDGYSDDYEQLLLSSSEAVDPVAHSTGAAAASPTYGSTSFQSLSGAAASATSSTGASPLRPTEYEDDFDE